MGKEISEYLRYDPDSGMVFWTKRNGPKRAAGDRAGHLATNGYRVVQFDGKTHLEHRLAWFLQHGEWPEHQIDHSNGNRGDNRLENLRSTNQFQNCQNQARHRGGKRWGIALLRGKWCASFRWQSRNHHVGVFKSEDLAEAALFGYLKGAGLLEPISPPIKRWER